MSFHRFFGCSLIPNFRHFGAERVPKRRFLGSLFGGISMIVAKVRMKLPCRRQHRFRGFRAPKKRQISPLFPEGVRGSSGAPFSYTFNDFGCPPGCKKEFILELTSAFFAVRFCDAFRALRPRRPGGAGGRGLLPEFSVSAKTSVAIPSRPAAPLRGVRRILRLRPCRRPSWMQWAAGCLATEIGVFLYQRLSF